MAVSTLEDLFQEELRDLYDAEKQLVKALPKMAKAASSEELRSAFQEHLEVTKGQVTRLEEAFQSIGAKAKGKTCEGMKGLVAEGQDAIDEDMEDNLHDILLIGAAKRVEHYEIAAYQTVIRMAESMGNATAAELMRQTLSEEEETDQKLDSLCGELFEDVSAGAEGGMEEEEKPKRKTASAAKARRAG